MTVISALFQDASRAGTWLEPLPGTSRMASNYRTTRSNSRIATLNGLAYTPSLIDDLLSDQNATPGPSPAMVSDETRLSDDGPTFHATKRKRPRHDASTPRKVVRITSSKRRTATATVLPISSQPPENWRKVYDIIKGMRSNIIAPADTTGCEQSKHKESDPKVCLPSLFAWHVLLKRRRTAGSRHSCISCCLPRQKMRSPMLRSLSFKLLSVELCRYTQSFQRMSLLFQRPSTK